MSVQNKFQSKRMSVSSKNQAENCTALSNYDKMSIKPVVRLNSMIPQIEFDTDRAYGGDTIPNSQRSSR